MHGRRVVRIWIHLLSLLLTASLAALPGSTPPASAQAATTVVAWGRNDTDQTTVPAGLTAVTAIAAGYYHSLALKSDGTVVAWGDNASGQTTIPAGLSGVTAIAAG